MQTIDELVQDMARTLLAEPGHNVVTIWRATGWGPWDGWGWSYAGNRPCPDHCHVVWSDVLDMGDVDPTNDPDEIDRYAMDIYLWLTDLLPDERDVSRVAVSPGQLQLL